MSFGSNLKHIRETLGLTQEECGNRVGLLPAEISHYETGARKPGLENIIKLCRGLGCTPNVLIKVKDEK